MRHSDYQRNEKTFIYAFSTASPKVENYFCI
jgi:hypothetical protein